MAAQRGHGKDDEEDEQESDAAYGEEGCSPGKRRRQVNPHRHADDRGHRKSGHDDTHSAAPPLQRHRISNDGEHQRPHDAPKGTSEGPGKEEKMVR